VPNTVHPLNETDGSLNLANLAFTASVKRALANDVTVCGEHEPVAYVTEYFLGDGVTTQFYLAADPFFPASVQSPHHQRALQRERNQSAGVGQSRRRRVLEAGRRRPGDERGQRIRRQTVLSWLDPVEMGGTLLLEAVGVTSVAGQHGGSGGFFTGMLIRRPCIAGFQATAQQGTGAVTLQPMIQGTRRARAMQ
jgi:hypothetical protein